MLSRWTWAASTARLSSGGFIRASAIAWAIAATSAAGAPLVSEETTGNGTTTQEQSRIEVQASESDANTVGEAPLNLQEIVVTARPSGLSKMRGSISVSTLDLQQIDDTGAGGVAELLKSIPGIRSESSGGESNANLTMRGVPLSAGGARYVQYQEDDLPVLQFGDIAFATPDSFLRIDSSIGRIEVVRGGSASTLATNAPGGIANFISDKGAKEGGRAEVARGLGFSRERYEAAYGGNLGNDMHFHLAGFFRSGDGTREPGVGVESGGQLRANLTREFEKGYVTVFLKHLEDRAPTYLPVPVRISASGRISRFPGIDPRDATFYTPYWPPDSTLQRDNTRQSIDINDGVTVKTDSIGLEGSFEPADGWTISDRFRIARNSGRFVGVFPGDDPHPVSSSYATGPKAGEAFSGAAFTAVVFNTELEDLGMDVNDLKLTREQELGSAGRLTGTAGLYTSTQRLDVNWNFNQYLLEARGHKTALLDSDINGTSAFGGCCSNTQDADYRTTSPYFVLAWTRKALDMDVSIRRDRQRATGTYNQLSFAGDGATAYDPAAARAIDYSVRRTSYSGGANYRLTGDLALFGRYSKGVAFNADRITFFHEAALVDGSSPVPVNTIKQSEAGVKWRAGGLSLFATFFHAKTSESNFDVTTQTASANHFDAKGTEVEIGYRYGFFRLGGGVTWTDAEIQRSDDPAIVNRTPKRQADVVWQLTPSLEWDRVDVGANVVGTTQSRDDGPSGLLTVRLPAYTVVNAFVRCKLTHQVDLTLSANNLFDELAYTESNSGRQAARALDGRSVAVRLRYAF